MDRSGRGVFWYFKSNTYDTLVPVMDYNSCTSDVQISDLKSKVCNQVWYVCFFFLFFFLGLLPPDYNLSKWTLLVSAKEFTGARYCSWMGRRRWGTGRRGRELAKAHGKNWICFHSSSNKQWGNFACAHLQWTHWLRGIQDRQFWSCESAVMRKKYLQGSAAQATSKSALLTINLAIRHIWSAVMKKHVQS